MYTGTGAVWENPTRGIPVRNPTPDTIQDFHQTHPAAPRPAQLKEFTFLPYQNHTTVASNVTAWTDGKIEPDAWNTVHSNIAETLFY